jgi:type VI secretion system protein ImpF
VRHDPPFVPLVPSLFDRLVDEHPGVPDRERPGSGMTPSMLRDTVLRDLRWLFNTTRCDLPLAGRTDEVHPGGGPCACRSVLDYGLPALAGLPASSCDALMLARVLGEALAQFEPRLEASSILVVPEHRNGASRQVLCYRIEGRLKAGPASDPLLMRTEIDLDSGITRVTELA